MIVDPDLLRMGAAFSQSAGTIAQRGAAKLSEAAIPSHIFGDLDAARDFYRELSNTHEAHVNTLQSFRQEFDSLADRAVTAATAFSTQDDTGASSIDSAANLL
ncbi:DUF2563 family protein [Mycobacterium hackensackense]|uniref:DUF2563 family protein n=1 Tax=Mycobacterium hackensackense TaxID=228909 RepID=UPI002265EDCB|nr:DUF2563 family protein [Mycobacterium hackensackense]MCV7253959.1 DUF2563 family protein [Mycobacterium hackensackense]